MTDPLEIVAILDVNAKVPESEYCHLLSRDRREPRRIYLSDCGAPGPKPGDGTLQSVDWPVLGRAVQAMAARVRAEIEKAGEREVELFIVAKAPLPLCAQLGAELSLLWSTGVKLFVLNPRRGGAWERHPLRSEEAADTPALFDVVTGLSDTEDPMQGCAAVFLSTVGTPAPASAMADLCKERAEPLGRVIEIRTSATTDITPANAAGVAYQIKKLLPQIQGSYPKASSYGLFIAGPVQLAFMVGLAINRHQWADGKLWFGHFNRQRYEFALSLPFHPPGSMEIPDSPADREDRRAVLDALCDGIEKLKQTLDLDDFPTWETDSRRQRSLKFLRDLKVVATPTGDEFGLSVLHRRLALGRGLAEALRAEAPEVQRGFGQLLLLHEIFHDGQDLRSSNYYDVGRAGVVLEEVDFAADCFALAVLMKWDLRRGGPEAQERPGELASKWVGFALRGIAAFDRAEQGEHLERLYERRLRRYLIWHLQAARAETLRPRDQVEDLLRGRLTVELAPLAGHLDPRFDKLVHEARPDTELFVALDGHLIRERRGRRMDPAALIEAARCLDRDDIIASTMRYLVDEHRRLLAPWTEGAI